MNDNYQMAGKFCKWLKMAGNVWKLLELPDMDRKCCTLLEICGNWMEVMEMAEKRWTW